MENPVTEDQLQAKCFKWFDNEFPAERRMLFAVPNGGERPLKRVMTNTGWRMIPVEANKLKATGTMPGVSDLIFVTDIVYFIEMKIPGGTQSDEQIDFMNKVRYRGHTYVVIYSFEEFTKFIISKLMKYYGKGQ